MFSCMRIVRIKENLFTLVTYIASLMYNYPGTISQLERLNQYWQPTLPLAINAQTVPFHMKCTKVYIG